MTEPAVIDSGLVAPPWWHHLRRPVVIDFLIVVTITLLTVYATSYTAPKLPGATVAMVWLVALAVSVPLMARRSKPVLALGIVVVSVVVAMSLGVSVTATVLAVAVALYPVALSMPLRRSAIALGAALLGVTLAIVLTMSVLDPRFLLVAPKTFTADLVSSLIFSWLTIGAGWTFGRNARARRVYVDQIAEHRAQKAVSEERLRIAREMHDVVAHSMSVIVMKAAVANHVYHTRPRESRDALGVIESVGRASLADIQRVLGSLRSAGKIGLEPSPGLEELPKLVANARLAHVQVQLERGTIPALPAAVQLSAYRIVQEALTNVIKHAAPARCTVRINAELGELCLAVINDGPPGRPVGQPGHGLIGMRERAALHHGTLMAGQQPGGGFAVHARLPYEVPGPA